MKVKQKLMAHTRDCIAESLKLRSIRSKFLAGLANHILNLFWLPPTTVNFMEIKLKLFATNGTKNFPLRTSCLGYALFSLLMLTMALCNSLIWNFLIECSSFIFLLPFAISVFRFCCQKKYLVRFFRLGWEIYYEVFSGNFGCSILMKQEHSIELWRKKLLPNIFPILIFRLFFKWKFNVLPVFFFLRWIIQGYDVVHFAYKFKKETFL